MTASLPSRSSWPRWCAAIGEHVAMADTVEVAGVNLGSKRRVVIDLALVGAILACGLAFGELRSTVDNLERWIPETNNRINAIEQRERVTNERLASKQDVARVEAQLSELRALILQRTRE